MFDRTWEKRNNSLLLRISVSSRNKMVKCSFHLTSWYMSGPETGKKGSECVSCCRVSSSESVGLGKETDIIILHFDFRMTTTVWIDKDKVCLSKGEFGWQWLNCWLNKSGRYRGLTYDLSHKEEEVCFGWGDFLIDGFKRDFHMFIQCTSAS